MRFVFLFLVTFFVWTTLGGKGKGKWDGGGMKLLCELDCMAMIR